MAKFSKDDKVRVVKGRLEGKSGIVTDPAWQVSQSDWPRVEFITEDGSLYFYADEEDMELAEDPYEYAVEWTVKGSDVPRPILADRWGQRGSAERTIEFNERMFPDKMEKYTVRLVKRRKAGKVEDV